MNLEIFEGRKPYRQNCGFFSKLLILFFKIFQNSFLLLSLTKTGFSEVIREEVFTCDLIEIVHRKKNLFRIPRDVKIFKS